MNNNESKISRLIKKSAYTIVIVLIIAVIALIILKYQVEGEKNMPFKLSSIIVVSNAEGHEKEENKEYKWNEDIFQNNDIYLNIEKNKNYKQEEAIKSIIIDNIQIKEKPNLGTVELYRLGKEDSYEYNYDEKYKINNQVEYLGNKKSDVKNLEISNQGGTIIFRIVNKTGKAYFSNEDEFEHNGKLLNKVGISYEDIKMVVSFDLTIKLESDVSFKTNIELQLPVGDIAKEGSSNLEITDMSKYVFKRVE